MCLGSQPQAPEVIFQGPSEDMIAAQQASMENWMAAVNTQNEAFQTQLQSQIDQNNSAFDALSVEYDNLIAAQQSSSDDDVEAAKAEAAGQLAEGAADAARKQVSALTVTSQQTEPEAAQTTQTYMKKKKKPTGLRISTAGVKNAGGSGVNLGI